MKKLIVLASFLCMGAFSFAQTGFSAGVTLGLPIGDAGDFTDFNLSLNTEYMFDVSEKFKVGPTLGYDLWLSKDYEVAGTTVEVDDISFLPVAAGFKFLPSESFFLGGDLGYAVGLNEGSEGGFYYLPKLGYYNNSFEVFGFYKGISNDGSLSSIGAGFMYHF